MQPVRFVVGSRDCDALGHLNVSVYFAYCNLAGFELLDLVGWTPGAANGGRRYSFAVVHSESEFLAEALAGDELLVQPGLAGMGGKSAVFGYRIARADGTAVFRSRWKSALMDLDTRRAVTVPEDLRAALAAHPLVD